MKLRLTPKIAYLLGLWKYRRGANGLGVKGGPELCEVFVSELVGCDIAPPEQIRVDEGAAFTYHSAYRKFFEDCVAKEDEIFRYNNEYSASFFAGLYDAVGGERGGKMYFAKADNADEVVLLRLGWKVIRTGRSIWVGPSDGFTAWIRQYRKVELPQKPQEQIVRKEKEKPLRKRRVYPLPPPK